MEDRMARLCPGPSRLSAAGLAQTLLPESIPDLEEPRCSSSRGQWRLCLPSLAMAPTPPAKLRTRLRELPAGSASDLVLLGSPSLVSRKQIAVSGETCLPGPPGSGAQRVRTSP